MVCAVSFCAVHIVLLINRNYIINYAAYIGNNTSNVGWPCILTFPTLFGKTQRSQVQQRLNNYKEDQIYFANKRNWRMSCSSKEFKEELSTLMKIFCFILKLDIPKTISPFPNFLHEIKRKVPIVNKQKNITF